MRQAEIDTMARSRPTICIVGLKDRLREIRRSCGMTIEQFSKRFGVSERAYSAYEHGERNPPVTLIVALVMELSVDAHWLLTGKRLKMKLEVASQKE